MPIIQLYTVVSKSLCWCKRVVIHTVGTGSPTVSHLEVRAVLNAVRGGDMRGTRPSILLSGFVFLHLLLRFVCQSSQCIPNH